MNVYFIGAGPGDPELITVKGMKTLGRCEMVIYAGSLVSAEILTYAENAVEVHDSASLTKEDMQNLFLKAKEKGWNVARLHTGDPSLYGTLDEQMNFLDTIDASYSVVPGVSSVHAAAAALKTGLTAPGVCQTLILSRMPGRTPVPEKESLENLAISQSTLALFLSAAQLEEIVRRLSGKYPPSTPAAIVYRASWPDEEIVRGTLENIVEKAKVLGSSKTSLIIIGEALNRSSGDSLLYDKSFTHGFRG